MLGEKKIIFCNLESELLRAGISKAALAAMVGVSISALYAKLNGSRPFKLSECQKIRRYLEIATDRELTIDYLFETLVLESV